MNHIWITAFVLFILISAQAGEATIDCKKIICSKAYRPVCGSDGKTYINSCLMASAGCEQHKIIKVVDQGPCVDCTKIICSKIYRPVCGSDGKTYSNLCLMGLAACEQHKIIKVVHQGPCADCIIACSIIYLPVCGSDGKTYSNECKLKRASCEQHKNITVVHQGRCNDCSIPCPSVYLPVCGSDGKTYSNECKLKRASCEQHKEITVVHEGRCIDCPVICPAIYGPVCGSDGKTYLNDCELKRASCEQHNKITVVHQGLCNDNCSNWIFIGEGCVGAKGNAFAEITFRSSPQFIKGMRLVYKSGYVGCGGNRRSHWGCAAGTIPLGILVTDTSDRIIYPAPRLVTRKSNHFYSMPGYTSSSPELVFADFGNPIYLQTNQKLRIWYAEDLAGKSESDNQGSTCMDIYAY